MSRPEFLLKLWVVFISIWFEGGVMQVHQGHRVSGYFSVILCPVFHDLQHQRLWCHFSGYSCHSHHHCGSGSPQYCLLQSTGNTADTAVALLGLLIFFMLLLLLLPCRHPDQLSGWHAMTLA